MYYKGQFLEMCLTFLNTLENLIVKSDKHGNLR